MSCYSLSARIATARSLVEECTRDATDIPPGVEADLWEALRFLDRLDEALDDTVEEDEDLPALRTDTGDLSESDDAAKPSEGTTPPGDDVAPSGDDVVESRDEAEEPGDGAAPTPDESALPQVHSYSDIVVFRPVEGGASQYIVAEPNTVMELAEWR